MKNYLATIDDEPAGWDGEQLVFASKKYWKAPLYEYLQTLKNHIKKSKEFRLKNNYDIPSYSYVIVETKELKK